MADKSAIEWTEATWNPVTGCTEVSPGCARYYAKTFAERFRWVKGHPYEVGFDLTLRPGRLTQPLEWRAPRLIFVNSMSDLFHEDVPLEFIAQVFEVMEPTASIWPRVGQHGRAGAGITSGTFYGNLQRYLAKAGLPRSGVHIFRHTAAKLRRDAGESIEAVSRFLDHSSLAATSTYLRRLEGEEDSGWASAIGSD